MGPHAPQARPGLTPRTPIHVRGRIFFVVLAVTAFAIDRALKLLVQQQLGVGERVELVDGVLALQHVHNYGIAFGLLSGMAGLVVVGSLVVGALLFTFLLRVQPDDLLTITGGALLTGGAVGNLVDRIQLGYVVDYIDLPRWPTFNVADVWITTGVALVILAQLLALRDERRAERQAGADTDDEPVDSSP
jgi:signal peptidase II